MLDHREDASDYNRVAATLGVYRDFIRAFPAYLRNIFFLE